MLKPIFLWKIRNTTLKCRLIFLSCMLSIKGVLNRDGAVDAETYPRKETLEDNADSEQTPQNIVLYQSAPFAMTLTNYKRITKVNSVL